MDWISNIGTNLRFLKMHFGLTGITRFPAGTFFGGPFLRNTVRRNRCGDLTFRRLSNSFSTELPDDSVGKIAVLWTPTTDMGGRMIP